MSDKRQYPPPYVEGAQVRLHVNLASSVANALVGLAKAEDVSLTEMLRRCVAAYVHAEAHRTARAAEDHANGRGER